MCVLYVSFGSNIRPRTWCVAMHSAQTAYSRHTCRYHHNSVIAMLCNTTVITILYCCCFLLNFHNKIVPCNIIF